MDIASGLSATATAIGIVKELREIDRSADEALFKLKIAELTEALADAKIALSVVRTELSEKDTEIVELKKAIEALKSGETCPICKTGHMQVTASIPHPIFGEFGHQERTYTCDNPNCSHSEKRKHDPSGQS